MALKNAGHKCERERKTSEAQKYSVAARFCAVTGKPATR